MPVRPRLGERLVQAGLITAQQLEKGLQVHAATGEQLGRTLVKLGYLDDDSLVRTLCADAGIPYLTLTDQVPQADALAAVPAQVANRYSALPLRLENGRLVIAMADPFDLESVSALERSAARPVKVVAAAKDAITVLIGRSYNGGRQVAVPPPPVITRMPAAATAAPGPAGASRATRPAARPPMERGSAFHPATIPEEPLGMPHAEAARETGTAAALADDILKRAIGMGATDVHLEPQEDSVRVRYRLDGLLQEGGTYPKSAQAPLMSRVKIVAGLDIAETRLPQDGRIRITDEGRNIDVRVSTYPTIYGEDVVLRVLDQSKAALDLETLGIDSANLPIFRAALARPHGLIAVTGPTGSGKTTTLYSALVELNTDDRCIMTLEDPVEYELPRVRQSQINPRAGLTFASGLRSMLRHDPNVILVGEIRDRDTVQIALSASLTGHLVLTTLHTTTAAGAIPRLLDMGAEPFVLASSLELVVSQRLIRLLCENCKVAIDLPPAVRERYSLDGVTVYGPRGCPVCRERGFRGRSGIFEFLPITESLAPAIYERRPAEEIHRLSGRPTILEDGLRKVRAGITSLDELLRVIVA